MSQQQIQTIVAIGIFVLFLGYRIYRQMREQRWTLGGMWVIPIIVAVIVIAVVAVDTVSGSPLAPLAAILGLAIGIGGGLYQGNHTTLRVDKPGRAVFVKTHPIGVALVTGVILLRTGIRWVVGGGVGQGAVGPNGLPLITPAEALIGSGLLAVALGLLVGIRWYVKRAYDEAPNVATPTTTTT